MRQTLTINSGQQKYTVTTESGFFSRMGKTLADSYKDKKIAVITDDTVMAHYGEKLKAQLNDAGINWDIISMPPGEESKSLDALPRIYSRLLDFQLTRGDIILAFGGGVIGDISGFAAATFLRGVNLINVPTTLMAMVDASIGGKNGANLPEGKNLAGTFYQPLEVFIDPQFVRTLPDSVFADGMAEVIKYGCAFDSDLFSDLADKSSKNDGSGIESIIYRCCLIKKQIIEQDSRDYGIAMLLNFGHTFGHCIEDYYPDGTFSHGEAISIGMYTNALAGEKKGLTAIGTAKAIRDLLVGYGLPYQLPEGADIGKISEAVKRDKKRRGNNLNLVVLERIGRSFLYQLDRSHYSDFIDANSGT